MNRERLHAACFCDARDGERVLIVAVPTGTNLQCDRHVDRADDGFENARDERLVLEQRRSGHDVTDFLRRTAHVDVDHLRAVVDVELRRFGQHRRIGASDLY